MEENIANIEKLTGRYAKSRDELGHEVSELEREIEALKKARLPRIRALFRRTAEDRNNLLTELEANEALFKKPKTRIFHGVKVGFKKRKGTFVLADDGKTIQLIKKHFPERADVLIKVKESVVKSALGALNAAALKKIGVQVTADVDEVLVKPVDTELDKLIAAMEKEILSQEIASREIASRETDEAKDGTK